MANSKLVIEVKFAWWLKPYLATLVFMCVIMGREPDQAKLSRVIEKSIRFKIK